MMHYFSFHIGDYASHTRHLTLIEDLAYRRLLDLYYSSEKPIIPEQAARLVGMREQAQEVLAILQEFFTETERGFINKRADIEIDAFRKRSESARISASKRWHKDGSADAMRSHTEPNANHKPITNNQEPIKTKEERAPRFDAQAHLVSIGVDDSIASDWIQSRKALKASPTLTAIDGIAKEAARAGISLADALSTCCQRGWRGFKAEWIAEDKKQPSFAEQREINTSATLRALGISRQMSPTPFDYIEGSKA
jgi:uncharacterized protein YdaU (DUF1376 family)